MATSCRGTSSDLSAADAREGDLRLTRGGVTAYAAGSHFAYLTTADVIDRAIHPRTDKLVQPRAAGFDMQMSALGLPWLATADPVVFHMGNRLAEGWIQDEYARLVGRRPPRAVRKTTHDPQSLPGRRWPLRKRGSATADAAAATRPGAATNRFLRAEYRLSGHDLAAHARLPLLDDVEQACCNLCGADDPEIVAARDRYGLPVRTAMCRRCGLMYLTPRPSADRYRAFRASGRDGTGAHYHRLAPRELEEALRDYFGPGFSLTRHVRKRLARAAAGGSAEDSRHAASQRYARHVYDAAREFVPFAGAVFEQNAADDAHLQPWRDQHVCTTAAGSPAAEAYDLVFNSRTIDHQLDPLHDLREAHRILRPGGVVFVEAPDAIEVARLGGLERRAVDIDRPQLFTVRTLQALVQAAGFEIVRVTQGQGLRDGREKQIPWIHIFGRKTDSPVAIDWPTFDHERAELAEAVAAEPRRSVEFGEKRTRRVGRHVAARTPFQSALSRVLAGDRARGTDSRPSTPR